MFLIRGILKKILYVIAGLLLLASAFALLTGRTYLFRAVYYTYLHGQKGPDILDKDYFYSREIKTAHPEPWPLSVAYGKTILNDDQKARLEKYKTTSFLIFRNDSLLTENYWEDFNESTVSNSFSMGKSIVSICIGIAIDEGKIKSVDQPVGDFIPSYQHGERAKLTVKHLLTMSAGLDWSESGGNPLSDNAEAYYGTDLRGMIEDVQVADEPGKKFNYQSGATMILGYIVEVATGQKLSDYAAEKIWQKVGAENMAFWSLDHENGLEKAYCCYYATARDFARFGKLYLQNGIWNGDTIVSPGWVKASLTPADLLDEDGVSPLKKYGYCWWMVDYKNWHAFYMRGILGQYVLCVPSENVIIVRTGHKRGEKQDDQPSDIFLYLDIMNEILHP